MFRPSHLIFVLLVLLLAACSVSPLPAETLSLATAPANSPVPPVSPTQPEPMAALPGKVSERRCGDGACTGPENAQNCPADCQQAGDLPTTAPGANLAGTQSGARPGSETNTYWVTNPTSGVDLYVRLSYPKDWDGAVLPTLVLVPGGTGTTDPHRADRLADAGFAVVLFDPDGRRFSQGQEDQGGAIQQDGLAAVIRAVATLPGVDASRIALVSYSYGVTMSTGALARYPDLPIRFYIDWEGPADRYDTTVNCQPNPRNNWPDCGDDAAWAQREALTFAAQITVPYQRVQSEQDHVQPDVSHAINMINAAQQGLSPWTRLNLETPNQTYDPANPPAMLPEAQDRQLDSLIARLAQELFTLFS